MAHYLPCPACGGNESAVVDSRAGGQGGREVLGATWVRRRRHCRTCDARWTTAELDVRDATANAEAWPIITALSKLSSEDRVAVLRLVTSLAERSASLLPEKEPA